MAQAQALRPVTTVVTAQSQETTQGQSLALVQNLLRAGISEVAYLRNFFDEDCFSTSSLGATKVWAGGRARWQRQKQMTRSGKHEAG